MKILWYLVFSLIIAACAAQPPKKEHTTNATELLNSKPYFKLFREASTEQIRVMLLSDNEHKELSKDYKKLSHSEQIQVAEIFADGLLECHQDTLPLFPIEMQNILFKAALDGKSYAEAKFEFESALLTELTKEEDNENTEQLYLNMLKMHTELVECSKNITSK